MKLFYSNIITLYKTNTTEPKNKNMSAPPPPQSKLAPMFLGAMAAASNGNNNNNNNCHNGGVFVPSCLRTGSSAPVSVSAAAPPPNTMENYPSLSAFKPKI